MAPGLVLTYFDIKGKAEYVRLALAVGGVLFEDRRLARGEWAGLKPQTRWRYLPELTVTEPGKAPVTFGQSNAQLRYVGRLAGLYPADEPLQAALVDEMLDALEDVRTPVADSVREEDPERKAEKRQKLAAETLPHWFGLLEGHAQANGANGHLVGAGLTVADLSLYQVFTWLRMGILDGVPATICDGYPALETVCAAVAGLEKVQAFERGVAERQAEAKRLVAAAEAAA